MDAAGPGFDINGIDFDYSDDKYTTALNIDKVDKDLRKKAERIENVMLF